MSLPEFKLIDGRVAKFIRRPKAIDASRANRIAGSKATDWDRNAALLAQVIEIDGQKRVMEDLLEMDMEDFAAIIGVIQFGRWETGAIRPSEMEAREAQENADESAEAVGENIVEGAGNF